MSNEEIGAKFGIGYSGVRWVGRDVDEIISRLKVCPLNPLPNNGIKNKCHSGHTTGPELNEVKSCVPRFKS